MSTTDEFRSNRDNFCYRHPGRQSFVLCQRCLRTICPECQTQGAVGVICPECLADQRKAQSPAQKKAERRWARRSAGPAVAMSGGARPIATYAIIAVTALVFLVSLIPGIGAFVQNAFNFAALYVVPGSPAGFQPWRALTVALVHGSVLHVALNMLTLWLMGRVLEPLLGPGRFVVLYLLGVLGGSAAAGLLDPGSAVVGASGGIFALFGALLIIGRHLGANVTGIAILIGVNFLWPFFFAIPTAIETGSFALGLQSVGVSWQSHLGGLVAGALVALVYASTRTRARRPLQIGMLVGVAVLLIGALALIPVIYA